MKNIHILPTDKARLYIHQGKLYDNKKTMHIPDGKQIPHQIYITSDEEIKEGDWCYYENGDLKGIHKVVNGQRPKTMILKKIILTTDTILIADGVQAIDDTFLEWFVKNPSCESVEIRDYKLHFGSTIYKIIIPQEEPQFVTVNIDSATGEDLGKVSYIPLPNVDYVPKQETLEEAAEKQWGKLAIINDRAAVIAFKAGAKWQAERMYSEEEPDYDKIKEALVEMRKIPMTFSPDERMYSEEDMTNYAMFILLNKLITPKEWFEQFKKK